MRRLFTITLLLTASITLLGQPLNRTFELSNGAVNLLGRATLERLQDEPYKDWFFESFDSYEVDTITLSQVNQPDSITVFLGTWCGDSRREVPRFFKMLSNMDFDSAKVGIICLNTGFQNYKQAPDREEYGMNIHRVPTFILHDENKEEIGRIVEEPVVSLEQDMVDITHGKSYDTHYPVAKDLIEKFDQLSIQELRKQIPKLAEGYAAISVNEYELNTYGYVLWTSFELVKAELVFELNHRMYPNSAYIANSLARFKANMGKQKEAWKYLNAGIKQNPEDESLAELAKVWKEEGL